LPCFVRKKDGTASRNLEDSRLLAELRANWNEVSERSKALVYDLKMLRQLTTFRT
jgi:hypothetical protein